jgi:hypothetical protein
MADVLRTVVTAAIRGLQVSEHVRQVFRRQIGLPKNRAQRSDGQVPVAVYGNNDQSASVRTSQVVMTPPDVRQFIPGPTKNADENATADPRKARQGVATSISTMTARSSY